MQEDFLHYLWRNGRFDLRQLLTTEGQPILIEKLGDHNTDAGPDFSNARILIAGMRWAGNVEIHRKASEWYDHGHERDPAYDNVILHVVMEEDRPVFRSNGERIPALELQDRIPAGLITNYRRLMRQENWIPCEPQWATVPDKLRERWLEQLELIRLERRANELQSIYLTEGQRDWESLFYRRLARSLGGKVNGEAMEALARSMPIRILLRHAGRRIQLEALLFGQSGLLLKRDEEEYAQLLLREYHLLRQKYKLTPLPRTIWRYLRLRPANFPDIRIAQLAGLLSNGGTLFGKALAAANPRELENMFSLDLSHYWRDHYRLGGPVNRRTKKLGRASIHSLLINAVAPSFLLYGRLRSDERFVDRAYALLRELPAENNAIIRGWTKLGKTADNAAEAQALLELKTQYCDQRRCLECAIGRYLLEGRGPETLTAIFPTIRPNRLPPGGGDN